MKTLEQCQDKIDKICDALRSETLEPAMKKALSFGSQILVEKYIKGREFTVGILGKNALPIVEVCPKASFFDFSAKYSSGLTEYVVPAILPDNLVKYIQQIALKAFHAIGGADMARIDFMLSDDLIQSGASARADNYRAWAITKKGLWITLRFD